MARTARLHYPGGLFHVISRCVGGAFLLDHPEIREAYVGLLGKVAVRTDARVLAYCVMSNHTHVVVVQGEAPLSSLFKPLNTGIAWHANRLRRGRGARGPVMAQRPRSLLVEEDAHLLELVRYVHNNPVRAGLVRHASRSDWSSHQAYLQPEHCPAWLHAGYVLERFGKRRTTAIERFERFVRDGAREPRRGDLSGDGLERAQAQAVHVLGDGFRVSDGVLGDAAYIERVERDARSVRDAGRGGGLRPRLTDPRAPKVAVGAVVEAVCAALDIEREQLDVGSQQREHVMARRLVTWVWVTRFGGKQVEVAQELRATSSVVARWHGAARGAIEDLDALADDIVHRVSRATQVRSAGPTKTRVQYAVVTDE